MLNSNLFLKILTLIAGLLISLNYTNCSRAPSDNATAGISNTSNVANGVTGSSSLKACGVNKAANAAASNCSTLSAPTSLDVTCSGSGLLSCLPNGWLTDSGLNTSGDCLEIYCVNGFTSVCLSGEQCPWRNDSNMKSTSYTQGFQYTGQTTLGMQCSPFGLSTIPDSTTVGNMITCSGTGCPVKSISCRADGQLTITK